MPNAHLLKSNICSFPCKNGDFTYSYMVSNKNESLICCRKDGIDFYLQFIDKGDSYLIKYDKITRPANVKLIQDAIKGFIDKNGMKIISSNIFSKKNHLKKSSPYLKDILFFKNLKSDKEIEIEIGFGSGRHILHQAKNFPEKIFIGIEIHKPSIEQLLKQCELQNISNIYVCNYDARILFQVLRSNSISKIYLHFPIPWDKKPHRRVISRAFIDETIRVLKQGGRLEIRTDSENYFRYTIDILLSLKSGIFEIRKNNSLEISSKYEDRWKKMEKNIYDIHFINREKSDPLKEYNMVEFDKKVDLDRLKRRFSNKVFRGGDYFVHFEKIYINKDMELIVLKVSFGDYEKSEHKYMVLSEKEVTFLPKGVLPIKQNIDALKIIKKYIYE